MKKTLYLVCIALSVLQLFSCAKRLSANDLLSEFADLYCLDGVIYSPEKKVGEEGYVYEGLMERVYTYEGNFPENYAVILNARTDFSSECGVFVCVDATQRGMIEQMCRDRIILLTGDSDGGIIIRSGLVVFYSTLDGGENVENAWKKIIRLHS